jgi:hypothetical protein
MLYSTSYAFFKFIKDQYQVLRRFRYEAEDGYATINGVPFLPVYLIPKRQLAWRKLGALLTEIVADFLDKDWMESACSRLTVPDTFHQRWCDIIESVKNEQSAQSHVNKNTEPTAVAKKRDSSTLQAPSRPDTNEEPSEVADEQGSTTSSEGTIRDSSNDDVDFEMDSEDNLGGG